MNEILVLFTYSRISLVERQESLVGELKRMKLNVSRLQLDCNEGKNDLVEYQDMDITVSLTNVGALVNIPVTKYRDFTSTEFVWNHLEQALLAIHANPLVWSFSKGNRFVFIKPVTEDKKDQLFNLILSKELMNESGGNGIFVEESIDKSCVLSCRYGLERYKDSDALSLKTMITSLSYKVKNLYSQVKAMNELMFDVWHWCMSQQMLVFLDSPKE